MESGQEENSHGGGRWGNLRLGNDVGDAVGSNDGLHKVGVTVPCFGMCRSRCGVNEVHSAAHPQLPSTSWMKAAASCADAWANLAVGANVGPEDGASVGKDVGNTVGLDKHGTHANPRTRHLAASRLYMPYPNHSKRAIWSPAVTSEWE
jgi:hypothetical protein